jgi:site-specific DNA-methyltransferase (adenine-specific)
MLPINEIIEGDCLEVLSSFPAASVDMVLTSPPYDNLRDYKGYTFNFEGIAKELYRITKLGGVVVWIVGDETINFAESLSSFNQVIFFSQCGFNLLDTMIYFKENYAPAYPNLRRYANQFEYMFVFSKGKPKTFNPIQCKKVRNKNESMTFRQKDGSLIAKKISKGRETKDASNVWSYPVGGNKTGHPAIFPEQLARDHILSWSNENDIILDPMCGSGTTCVAAKELKRNYIGIEIAQEYANLARERIKNMPTKLF